MRYTVSLSYVDVLGYIWMPHALCSTRITLSAYDLGNIADEGGNITREDVEQWLTMHTGDFSNVVDFNASIEWNGETLDFPWSTEENECAYFDTVGECEY